MYQIKTSENGLDIWKIESNSNDIESTPFSLSSAITIDNSKMLISKTLVMKLVFTRLKNYSNDFSNALDFIESQENNEWPNSMEFCGYHIQLHCLVKEDHSACIEKVDMNQQSPLPTLFGPHLVERTLYASKPDPNTGLWPFSDRLVNSESTFSNEPILRFKCNSKCFSYHLRTLRLVDPQIQIETLSYSPLLSKLKLDLEDKSYESQKRPSSG